MKNVPYNLCLQGICIPPPCIHIPSVAATIYLPVSSALMVLRKPCLIKRANFSASESVRSLIF